ncbi:MAG: hypothetical protein RLY16_2634 [Bacteroidota bacterium]
MTENNRTNHSESQRFEALFQYASIGILVANQQGEILLANNFLLDMFGYGNVFELIGKKVEVLIPTRYHHHHDSLREGYADNPQKRPMGQGRDLFGRMKDGTELPVEVSLSSYHNDQGFFVIGFVNDITKRKSAEQQLIDQQQVLETVNKQMDELNNELEQKVNLRTLQLQETLVQLEMSKDELTKALKAEKELSDMKTRFVSMASHEFRTPLSTILSSASLVAKYTQSEEQEKRDKHIHRIKTAVYNLTDILNEFLSIGKLEAGKISATYSYFNIYEMLNTITSEMQGIVRGTQQIVYQHEGQTEVLLDSTLLRNIVINLLSNAIKFSYDNGIIHIYSENLNGKVVVRVVDNGIGMSEDDQQHLFERFFRGANVTNIQGTGLGLHIVSKYVELMNGQIQCSSVLEEGTTFTITFTSN